MSVHLSTFPEPIQADTELISTWNKLFEVREQVLGELEKARTDKTIGSSLEAKVIIHASAEDGELLKRYAADLRYLFIVSQVELKTKPDETRIEVQRAQGTKCERCWNYSTRVGEFERYPTVCERCDAALKEIEDGHQR